MRIVSCLKLPFLISKNEEPDLYLHIRPLRSVGFKHVVFSADANVALALTDNFLYKDVL